MVRTETEIQNMIERYVAYLSSEIKIDKIILFGSYASGTATEDSDIDIAIDSQEFSSDYISECQRLHKGVWRSGIDPKVEPIPLHSVVKPFFIDEVYKTGKVIYQADPTA